MDNIFVYLVDLPPAISEMVTPCDDGFTVYLNARFSRARQEQAYLHAITHIIHNDFESDNIQSIEHEAHHEDHKDQIGIL